LTAVSGVRLGMTLRRAALPVLMLAPLFGCGPGKNEFAPACPVAVLVPTLADLTRFNGAGRDLTDLIVQARIVQVNGSCSPGSTGTLAASVSISITIQRGPSMSGRDADVPVFVAVTRGEDVLDKQMLPVHISFPPNVDRVSVTSNPINLSLPVGDGVSGPSYRVIAGFQLTPEEVDANRQSRVP
jgi:hypothetical protein